MIKRLPEADDQFLLAVEFGLMALGEPSSSSCKKMVILPLQDWNLDRPMPEGFVRGNYAKLPQGVRFDQIIAIDLLSEVEDQYSALREIESLLNPEGQLVVIQSNVMMRRGIVPPEAGGPFRTPTYYHFRSFASRLESGASLAVGYHDRALELLPTAKPGMEWPEKLAPSNEAVCFVASNKLISPCTKVLPENINKNGCDIVEVSPDIALGATRSVAFIIDVREWAFDNIVKNISPYLAGRYVVSSFYITDYESKADLIYDIFVKNSFDHVHFMWREVWFNTLRTPSILQSILQKHKLSVDVLAELLSKPCVTTTVYDHLLSQPEEIIDREISLALTDAYSTSSHKLQGHYTRHATTPPSVCTQDGVDTAFFSNNKSAYKGDGTLRIGWVGNSNWGNNNKEIGDDPKGLHSILFPAIDKLKSQGLAVDLILADSNSRKRSREEMRQYYRDEIDIIICASSVEGTPNPILEAMASGKPWISTDVGIVREVSGPLQEKLILEKRSASILADTIASIYHENLREIAEENRAVIFHHDWRYRASKWTSLFKEASRNSKRKTSHLRRSHINILLNPQLRDRNISVANLENTSADYKERYEGLAQRLLDIDIWTTEMTDYIKELEHRASLKGFISRATRKLSRTLRIKIKK